MPSKRLNIASNLDVTSVSTTLDDCPDNEKLTEIDGNALDGDNLIGRRGINASPIMVRQRNTKIVENEEISKAKNEFEIKLPENLSEKELTKLIKQVEKRMKEHALNLEYEDAAKCRDELKLLRDLMFKS